MNKRIKKIIRILTDRKEERYYGFVVTKCSNGQQVEGHITGGESNITKALTHDGNEFVYDYYLYIDKVKQKDIFSLPYAGCDPKDIREYVNKEFKKRNKSTI